VSSREGTERLADAFQMENALFAGRVRELGVPNPDTSGLSRRVGIPLAARD
jgi:hypothetical protein